MTFAVLVKLEDCCAGEKKKMICFEHFDFHVAWDSCLFRDLWEKSAARWVKDFGLKKAYFLPIKLIHNHHWKKLEQKSNRWGKTFIILISSRFYSLIYFLLVFFSPVVCLQHCELTDSFISWPAFLFHMMLWTLSHILKDSSFSSVAELLRPHGLLHIRLPVHHQLLELAQTHVHRVGDVIQPSHPLLSTSPPALSLSQHQRLFQWVSSSHQVAKVLELQLQHQSFQWIFRTDFI